MSDSPPPGLPPPSHSGSPAPLPLATSPQSATVSRFLDPSATPPLPPISTSQAPAANATQTAAKGLIGLAKLAGVAILAAPAVAVSALAYVSLTGATLVGKAAGYAYTPAEGRSPSNIRDAFFAGTHAGDVRFLNEVRKEVITADDVKNVGRMFKALGLAIISPFQTKGEDWTIEIAPQRTTLPKPRLNDADRGAVKSADTPVRQGPDNDVAKSVESDLKKVPCRGYTSKTFANEATRQMIGMMQNLDKEERKKVVYTLTPQPIVTPVFSFQTLDAIKNGDHDATEFVLLRQSNDQDKVVEYKVSGAQIRNYLESVQLSTTDGKPETLSQINDIIVNGLTRQNVGAGRFLVSYVKLPPCMYDLENKLAASPIKNDGAGLVNVVGEDLANKEVVKACLHCASDGLPVPEKRDNRLALVLEDGFKEAISSRVKAVVDQAKAQGHNAIIFPGIGVGAFVDTMQIHIKNDHVLDYALEKALAALPEDQRAEKKDEILHALQEEFRSPSQGRLSALREELTRELKEGLRATLCRHYLSALGKELQNQGITLILTDPNFKNNMGQLLAGVPVITTGHDPVNACKILMQNQAIRPLLVNAGDQNGIAGYHATVAACQNADVDPSTMASAPVVTHVALEEAIASQWPLAMITLMSAMPALATPPR